MNARPPQLPAPDAYRLWAQTYDEENPVTILELECVAALTPPLAGKRLLDAACGTGRRLPVPGADGPALALGVDLVPEMLLRGRSADRSPCALRLVAADVRALPLPDRTFDVVWCRLAAGHLPELHGLYRELARVALPCAHVIVTDFHPAAARAGHVRSFRDARGVLHVVEHHIHEVAAHVRAADCAGLPLAERIESRVSDRVREHYVRAGRLARFERDRGLPLVLALAFRG